MEGLLPLLALLLQGGVIAGFGTLLLLIRRRERRLPALDLRPSGRASREAFR